MKRYLLILAILATWAGSPARAGLVVEFGQSSYTVSAGGSVEVQVFLRQTGGETILTDEGLFAAGLQVNFNVAPFTADPAQVSGVVANPAFNFIDTPPPTPATSGSAGSAVLDVADFSAAGAVFPTLDEILLGTFTFQAGLAGTTLVNVTDLDSDPSLDNFLTGSGTALDGLLSFGTTRIVVDSVSAVPEPGTLISAAIGVAGLVLYRLRHRSV